MNCEYCGANVALVGKMHRCVPRPAVPVGVANSAAPPVANTIRGGDVANGASSGYRCRDAGKRRPHARIDASVLF
jgi:hypothetical protein